MSKSGWFVNRFNVKINNVYRMIELIAVVTILLVIPNSKRVEIITNCACIMEC